MRKYVLIVIVICVALGGLVLLQDTDTKTPLIPHLKVITPSRIKHSSHLFDPAFFDQASAKGQQYKSTPNDRVLGGIIPHHLLAGPLIAGFFEGISDQEITTIILISPNHHGIGHYNISTSKGIWTTIYGDLETDKPKISQLNKNNAVFVSEDLFDIEHGIYGITPFIKKTFPNIKFIPIAINPGTSKEEGDKLVKSLNKIIDDQTIVLVSADFSHYLPSDQADTYDKESISAITSFDSDKVLGLDHMKNIDSPESVYILLKLMQLKNASNTILIENTNSAKLTNQPEIQSTTSYVTMYFTQTSQH